MSPSGAQFSTLSTTAPTRLVGATSTIGFNYATAGGVGALVVTGRVACSLTTTAYHYGHQELAWRYAHGRSHATLCAVVTTSTPTPTPTPIPPTPTPMPPPDSPAVSPGVSPSVCVSPGDYSFGVPHTGALAAIIIFVVLFVVAAAVAVYFFSQARALVGAAARPAGGVASGARAESRDARADGVQQVHGRC